MKPIRLASRALFLLMLALPHASCWQSRSSSTPPATTPAPAPNPNPNPNPPPSPPPSPGPLGNLPVNTWVQVSPTYTGQTNGGWIFPMGWNSKAAFDPLSQSVVVFERWYDTVRQDTIYANALIAYNPATNVANVLKLNNWQRLGTPSGGYETVAMPQNSTDPTPADRHPLGCVSIATDFQSLFLTNGLNQSLTINGVNVGHPNDTWSFDLAGSNWTKVSDPTSPSNPPQNAGSPSVMTYDPVSKNVVFLYQNGYFNGTQSWLLNPATRVWTVVPQDPSSLQVNVSASGIAYDSKRQWIVTFGGGTTYDQSSTTLSTYSVSQNRWASLASCPQAANAPGFDYDSTHDIFLAQIDTATWIYDPLANQWTQLTTSGSGPSGAWHSVTYDPVHDVFVYQGGTWNNPLWFLLRYK